MRKVVFGIIFLLSTFAFAESLENALINAVNNDDYSSVVSLLNSGANPDGDISNPDAITPLGLACNKGNTNIVSLLLKKEANPNYKPTNNASPFFYTVMGTQKPEIMKMLIDYGLNINKAEPGQDHYAFTVITLGHSKTLKILIDSGLNKNITNQDGYTLFEWAKKNGRRDCIDILDQKSLTLDSNEEVILISYDKLYYQVTHNINDNSENTIYLNESIFIPKGILKVVAQAPYYSVKRYLVQFDTYYYSGPFLIELEQSQSLNVTYNGFINQDLRLALIGYGTYSDNDIEKQTYRFKIDNREIQKKLIKQNISTETREQNESKTTDFNDEPQNIETNETTTIRRDYINLSILGGISFSKTPILDLNLKFLISNHIFIVLQGGATPANNACEKISSMNMLPEGTIGIGGYIKPIKAYQINIFGYASAGVANIELKGGYIRNGTYTTSSFYSMLRGCVGLDFPINNWFAISFQDCFDYLFNLGFTNSLSTGLTIKI